MLDSGIAQAAALIGEPGRAAMLMALIDGRALPAGELAYIAGLTAQAASNHLVQLIEGGLLAVEREGRHRYYRLADVQVATVLEALAALGGPPRPLRQPRLPQQHAFCLARRCYDHLAGRLGVTLAQELETRQILITAPDQPAALKLYDISKHGAGWFTALGLDVAAIKPTRRGLARRCLDWTERRHHVGGLLGVRLMQRLVEMAWLSRDRQNRVMRVTDAGDRGLRKLLNIDVRAL
ncbi:helix-turn-helix transcriptional regulator [Reyranella sp. CPCC 100927]|uniref:ArsR/SmtB family transcription factor n=1 Tax=Reyranella sp. CPCC 100927 TaxID=2599616 RepID=UPI001C49B143|nr:helix-turn-helix transcriptional regulator [Reyranella sp. CPCC 100927]